MKASLQPCRVAIAGASSLRGKELKQLLEERSFPLESVRLLDEEAVGTLTEAGGEATFVQSLEEDSFAGARFAFFAGEEGFTGKHWGVAHRAGATVIDLSGALAGEAAALPWIPSLDATLPPPEPAVGKLFWSLGAAGIIATTLAAALAKLPVARLSLVFFRPVSERGQAGIDELEGQTAKLLSLQPVPQAVYDTQVAFNLLTQYGSASVERLDAIRAALSRSVVRYLAGRAPVPAIQVIQAPVFHAAAFSAFVELSAAKPREELQAALAGAGITVAAADDPPVSNLSVAGSDGITISRVEPDASIANGHWIWGAADNVRLTALNAVQIAEKLLAS